MTSSLHSLYKKTNKIIITFVALIVVQMNGQISEIHKTGFKLDIKRGIFLMPVSGV